MKILITASLALVVLFAFYITFAFGYWQFDPSEWDIITRFAMALLWLTVTASIIGARHIEV